MDRVKKFGQRIQELRKEKQLTQASLAEAADLATNYIGEIERGEAKPTLQTILAIADALEISPSDLLRPLDKPRNKQLLLKAMREILEELEAE